jgi:hypothetical protein
MNNLLSYTIKLNTYSEFNKNIVNNLVILIEFKNKIEKITPYGISINKILSFGHIMKCFYDLYNDPLYNECFLYSFGFNGYIDNLEGIISNIKEKYINYAKVNKSNRLNKQKSIFKNSYYPSIMYNNPIKNTIIKFTAKDKNFDEKIQEDEDNDIMSHLNYRKL